MARRHEMIAPRGTFSKSTMTTAATASAAGVLMGFGAPIALAAGNGSQPQAATAVALATPAVATNNVTSVNLGNVSVGEWEMETVVVEAERAAASTRTAEARTSRARQAGVDAAVLSEPVSVRKAASGAGSSVLATALSYQGAPYRWGGTTPAGWDCIGFVRYVYAQHGVRIGGSTTSVLSAGYRVPYSEARAGDILYWPGHVGISLGNGTHVGAWNPQMGTRIGADSHIGVPTVIRVF